VCSIIKVPTAVGRSFDCARCFKTGDMILSRPVAPRLISNCHCFWRALTHEEYLLIQLPNITCDVASNSSGAFVTLEVLRGRCSVCAKSK